MPLRIFTHWHIWHTDWWLLLDGKIGIFVIEILLIFLDLYSTLQKRRSTTRPKYPNICQKITSESVGMAIIKYIRSIAKIGIYNNSKTYRTMIFLQWLWWRFWSGEDGVTLVEEGGDGGKQRPYPQQLLLLLLL